MTRTAKEILADPEYQKNRRQYDAALERTWEKRRLEAQMLLDDLQGFGLSYENIHDLVDEPKNTFALAITRMIEYLDIFEDPVNLDFLAMALARPEGQGLVAKPMIKSYKSSDRENFKLQACKAILATAEPSETNEIIDLLFKSDSSDPEKILLLRAVTMLSKKGALPILLRCLELSDDVAIESLKSLKKLKLSVIPEQVRSLEHHDNDKIRRLAQALL